MARSSWQGPYYAPIRGQVVLNQLLVVVAQTSGFARVFPRVLFRRQGVD